MNPAFTPLEKWTFNDLVQHNQATVLMAIPVGQFNQAIFDACGLVLRWKALQPKAPA
jgi:hypothetical protein